MDIALRNMSHIIKQDLRLSNNKQDIALPFASKGNRKQNQDACCRTVKSVTKKSSLQMKKSFAVEETFN